MAWDLRLVITLIIGCSLFLSAAKASEEPAEGPPLFFAGDLLPPEMRKGEAFEVDPIVQVKEFGYVFVVRSPHGEFRALGVEALAKLIHELNAIDKLREVGQTEAFAASVTESIKDPLRVTYGVARRPIATVAGIPSGLARYLQGKFFEARKTSDDALEQISEFRQRQAAPEEKEADDPNKPGRLSRLGSSATDLGKSQLGYYSAIRHWARKMEVDPYSDNAALQEALTRLGWASTLGSFAGDLAMPSSEVFSYADQAQDIVWSKPPIELARMNQKRLKELGVSKETLREFLTSDAYSLSEKTRMTLALKDVGPVSGLEEFLNLILQAQTEEDAFVMVRTCDAIGRYCSEASALDRLELRHGMLFAQAANGYWVLPLAVDYLHWSPLISEALTSDAFDVPDRELWITGESSAIARHRLRKLGWYLRENCLGDPTVELAGARAAER